jgi:hypothetical protein
MLSFSSAYTAQATGKNIVTDWLLELSYDDTTPGTFYFSGFDRRLTNYYQPLVMDWGTIDESIDLAKSQNSISDVTIELVNKWPNESGLLSAELFGGSKKFINQDVVIKSWIDGVTYANCPTVYKGRLVDIQHTQETVTLSIEKRSPWDRIKIPSVYSTNLNVLFPSVYGDYTRNESTVASPSFCESKALFPTPINEIIGNNFIGLLPDVSSPSEENLHIFEKGADVFVPLDPVNETSIDSYNGGVGIAGPTSLKRGFYYRPLSINGNDSGDFTNPSQAIDGNTATYAEKTFDSTTAGTYSYTLDIDCPELDGVFGSPPGYPVLYVKFELGLLAGTTTVASPPNDGVGLYDDSYGGASTIKILSKTSVPNTLVGVTTINGVAGYEGENWSTYITNGNQYPDTIKLQVDFTVEGGGGKRTNAYIKIYDVFISSNVAALDFTDEKQASVDKINAIDKLYCGTDGLTQGFTGGSGIASYPHDIYRDMLNRYAGWDASDIDDVAVNDGVWTDAIDTDRAWPCRWWTLEQKSLLDVLKQLQFEGAFIWVFDGTNYEARVIYVKSSYASTDLDLDYENLANIKVSTTPFSEIVTKRTFNFQRHPADEKRYIQTNSLTNANRADYNLDAEENAIEQDLDFLTDSDDVDDLLEYYDNIVGEPKVLVQCDILKPSDRALQVGDIVQFNNMAYEPYGKSWASIYFMCVKTQIAPNKFTATFREVG